MKNNIIKRIPEIIKNQRKEKLIVLLLAGVLLVVISLPVKDTKPKEKIIENPNEIGDVANYEEYLENKLEKNLSKISGLGKVSVIVKVKDTGESVLKSNITVSENVVDETDSSGGSRKTTEKTNEEQVIMKEIDGNVTPYIMNEKYPQIEGVVVIAQGGDDATLKVEVIEAIEALFSISPHKIKVLKMK